MAQINETIENAKWYWADLSRDEASDKLKGKPDGTFLVRDSSSNVPGEYTLTLRKRSTNKLIKIFTGKDGLCGFAEPYRFASVMELIAHYRENSLVEYTPSLDVRLLYPVSKYEQMSFDDVDMKDLEVVKRKLDQVNDEMREKNVQFDQLCGDLEKCSANIVEIQKSIRSFKLLAGLLAEHMELHEKMSEEVKPHETKMMENQKDSILKKMKFFGESCTKLEKEFKLKTAYNKLLLRVRSSIKPSMQQLGRQRAILQRIVDGKYANGHIQSMMRESAWFLPECKRSAAEALLLGRKTGTFLIRNSTQQAGSHALSVVCDGRVFHCLIIKTDRGYGFSAPYAIHADLLSLVLHYSSTSLEEHNDSLLTTLKYPFNHETRIVVTPPTPTETSGKNIYADFHLKQ